MPKLSLILLIRMIGFKMFLNIRISRPSKELKGSVSHLI